jgi:hypothetical protein
MGPGILVEGDSPASDVIRPTVHVLRTADDKTDVGDRLDASRMHTFRKLMDGKVVLAGCEIDVIGIGNPLDLHSKNIAVKIPGSLNIADVQGDVAEA